MRARPDFLGPICIWSEFVLRNDTAYQYNPPKLNFTLLMDYIVEMSLRYMEYRGPLAAFSSDIYRFIVMDQIFAPILIAIAGMQTIS